MRKLSGFLAVVASILFIVTALLTAVDVCCFDLSFFDAEYRKLDSARAIGIGHTDLMSATEQLLDFTRGKVDSLDVKAEINGHTVSVFNEREIEHMEDVRDLYKNTMLVRNLGALLCAVLFAVSIFIWRKERLRRLSKCFFAGGLIIALLVGALALWAGLDFNSFWETFHRVLFANDLWQLDPSTSVLINMVPAQFFYDLVMRIVKMFALFVGIPMLLALGYQIYHRIRRRSFMVIPEKGGRDAN